MKLSQKHLIITITIILVVCMLLCFFSTQYTKSTYEDFDSDIPTYLVSLEKDHERRKLLYIYVTPHEYNSVDGSKLVSKEKLQQKNVISNTDITNGEIGCYLSHYNTLNKIQNYKHEYSMILEDDVILDIETTQEKIREIAKSAPSDWEVLFLGHNFYEEDEENTKNVAINDSTFKKVKLVFGMQCYLVKNDTITGKIHKLLPIKGPIDVILPTVFTSYIVEPKIAELSKFSGISNTQGII